MNVLFDTNILVSALVFPGRHGEEALQRIVEEEDPVPEYLFSQYCESNIFERARELQMADVVTNIKCDPSEPTAGQPFRLTITLDEAATSDTTFTVEKQRICRIRQDQPGIFAIELGYWGKPPGRIAVQQGSNTGESDEIVVSATARQPSTSPPVAFPEQLLFSAYNGQAASTVAPSFRALLVRVVRLAGR